MTLSVTLSASDAPSLFHVADRRAPVRSLKLLSIETRAGDLVWLRYKVL